MDGSTARTESRATAASASSSMMRCCGADSCWVHVVMHPRPQWQPTNRPCKVHRKVVVDYSHPAGVTSLPLRKLIDCLDVLPQHGSSSRPIVSMNHARAKLATVDEKLEERVYVFYSAERETRTPWISSEDEFEKLSDPGNVLFESIVGVCAFLFF